MQHKIRSKTTVSQSKRFGNVFGRPVLGYHRRNSQGTVEKRGVLRTASPLRLGKMNTSLGDEGQRPTMVTKEAQQWNGRQCDEKQRMESAEERGDCGYFLREGKKKKKSRRSRPMELLEKYVMHHTQHCSPELGFEIKKGVHDSSAALDQGRIDQVAGFKVLWR